MAHTGYKPAGNKVGGKKKASPPVSQEKAKKILEDGTIRGKPLTARQKRFFGLLAGGGKPIK